MVEQKKPDPLSVSIKNVPYRTLRKSVVDRHDWCSIANISDTDWNLGQDFFVAHFTDGYKFVFEVNEERLRLMLSEEQTEEFQKAVSGWTEEDLKLTLETILLFFLRWKEKRLG
jgi:hypothetical protein